jgi:hypothetical protein
MEKITLEDALMIENVVNKINEVIDRLDAIDKRIDAHWKFHRFLGERIEKMEEKLGLKKSEGVKND